MQDISYFVQLVLIEFNHRIIIFGLQSTVTIQ